jgi:PAS domain S-box-containing protein
MFADRELTLRVTSTPAYYAARVSPMPRLVAAGGGLLCVVLALYLGSLRRENVARARIDEALVESEHRYRTLVEYAPDAVVVYDVDARRFVDANNKAAVMLEAPRERLLESSPLDFSPKLQPDGRESTAVIEDLVERTLAGESVVLPWNRRSADGTEHPVEIRLTPMPDASRRLIRCSVIDVRERRQSELRQLMMARELDHRVKNNLATVLSVAEQTCASARSIEEFRESFVGRVRAMARSHEALATRRWDGVPLDEIAQLTLEPYLGGSRGRATLRGEPVRLSAAASSCLCMAFHELAANAAKYGALSEPAGRIDLAWERSDDGALAVEWTERDGPRVVAPTTAGLGSRLIKGVLSHELGGRGTLEYGAAGVRCRMSIPSEHWSVEGAKA